MYGEVTSVEPLSPSMVRIVLGGGDLAAFTPTPYTDQYINASFVPADAPYDVPFDAAALDGIDAAMRPKPRRYTVRHWNQATNELTIDFVAHGDIGYAGSWAQRATPGDRLQFKGPGGGYAPDSTADWHLYVGDESALPAIAASLEQVAPGARSVAVIVVDGPDNEQQITSPGDLELRWLHRRTADAPDALLHDAVAALDFPPGRVDLFVHGEAGEVRDVRRHLAVDRGLDVDGASISPYWRRNYTDEDWRAVKAQWTAEMRAETS
ncbi:MAG: siderophore-interacting protein [Actinomycetota bacterium]